MHVPRKRFGQNFLHDPGVIAQIITAISPRPREHMVEIGPGRGAITSPLLAHGIELDAIELDRDLIMDLRRLPVPVNASLRIHNADALAFDLSTLVGDGRKLRVVGNLPYNISTPLLFHLLAQHACIQDMHLMLQKEVVERMAAGAGGREYGRLSIMVQYRCRVQPLFNIGPGAFLPRPKVESCLVRLLPHERPDLRAADDDALARLVKAAFTHRRKTLRNALKGVVTAEDFAAAGVDADARPEQLELTDYVRLSDRLAATAD